MLPRQYWLILWLVASSMDVSAQSTSAVLTGQFENIFSFSKSEWPNEISKAQSTGIDGFGMESERLLALKVRAQPADPVPHGGSAELDTNRLPQS